MLNASFDCFDWDQGNLAKCQAHGIAIDEIERALTRDALLVLPDDEHSQEENRLIAIGRNDSGRSLLVICTLREINGRRALRPISARYMHRKEVEHYEQARTDIKK